MELGEFLHVSVQGTRSNSAVQGDGEIGAVPRTAYRRRRCSYKYEDKPVGLSFSYRGEYPQRNRSRYTNAGGMAGVLLQQIRTIRVVEPTQAPKFYVHPEPIFELVVVGDESALLPRDISDKERSVKA